MKTNRISPLVIAKATFKDAQSEQEIIEPFELMNQEVTVINH